MTSSLEWRLTLLSICAFLTYSCNAQTQSSEGESNEDEFMKSYEAAIAAANIPYNQTLVFDTTAIEPLGIDFTCSEENTHQPATSVHELTPFDIKVVGAVGDSVTAGFGAKAKFIWEAATEYRGISWSIGGDKSLKEWVTIPNIIKEYNEDVIGYSTGIGKSNKPNAHLNRAVSAAVAANIPSQVNDLIARIKEDPDINIEEDWKLVTIWIGGNDLCAVCNDRDGKSSSEYARHIKEAINLLKEELPRTFVNLVQILDVTLLGKLQRNLLCKILHLFVCSCGVTKKSIDETSQAAKNYNSALVDMVRDGNFDDDEFAVVLQPFFTNIVLPPEDEMSYFGLDCFHFSAKGHKEIAKQLWNNMLEPVGSKYDHIDWGTNSPLKCPTQNSPYFYTRKNSKLVNSVGAVNSNPNSDSSSDSPNLLGVLLGTAVVVYVAAMSVIIAVIAIVYTRRRRQRTTASAGISVGMAVDTERTTLIFEN